MNADVQRMERVSPGTDLFGMPLPVTERFEFHASGEEYFRIWIVNLALTLVTLGIYSAWAKVRRLRYFHGSTLLAGSAFQYDGKPMSILKGRLIVLAAVAIGAFLIFRQPLLFFAFAVVVGILTPVVVVRGRLFRMRMTSYRNIRFDFERNYRGAYRAFFWLPLLASIIVFFYPRSRGAQFNYSISNTRFGKTNFAFRGSEREFFGTYFAAGLILFGSGLLFSTFLAEPLIEWLQNFVPSAAMSAVLTLVPFIGFAIAYPLYLAFLDSSIANKTLGVTAIGTSRLVCGMEFLPLLKIYAANSLFLVLTLGLYYPWARVGALRYKLESLKLELDGGMEHFIGEEQSRVSAVGEELSEILDVDIGI